MSNKLKKSHTLDGYIQKYGEKNGKEKYKQKQINVKNCKNINYFINKHGIEKGTKIYNKIQESKGVSLKKYINKYGINEGTKKYNLYREKHKKSKNIEHFILLYGKNEGLNRWFEKNNKISKSNRKIPIDKLEDFEIYKLNVDKFTRITLQIYNIKNINKRSEKFHLDHKFSKTDGFLNNIPAEIIGHFSNLEIVTQHYNSSKQHNSNIYINHIIEKYNVDSLYQEICKMMKNNM